MQLKLLGISIMTALCINAKPAANVPVSDDSSRIVATGIQPEIAIDDAGKITIAYGVKGITASQLYCITSADGGKTFSKPFNLGSFDKMGLGMGRGPQMAATKDYLTITFGSHYGQLYALRYSRTGDKWSDPVKINDTDSTAKEALSDIAAGTENTIFTAWLDTRLGRNNLYGARSKDGGVTWEPDQLVYQGLEGGICDCCKPSVFIDRGGSIHVMFRNKLEGARNMYVISSTDNGRHFGQARKLGKEDFTINGCPMDGGDLTANGNGNIITVWRRQTDVYVASPDASEKKLGAGRTPVVLTTTKGEAIAWHHDNEIYLRRPNGKPVSIGKGQYPKLALVQSTKTVICAYENDGKVLVKSIKL